MEYNISYNAYEGFRPHFDALARVAYFKIVYKSLSPVKRVIHKASRIFVWIIVLTYNLQLLIRAVQVRGTDQVVNTLFIMVTTLNSLTKQVAFNVRSRRIDHILSIISGPIFAPIKPYHVAVMKSNAVVMYRLLTFYIGCIFASGTLLTIFPLVNRSRGLNVELTGYFPFDTSLTPIFELAVAYMTILMTFQGYGTATMDCTIVAFYAQGKVQLKMLRYNLEHLVDSYATGKDKKKSKRNNKVLYNVAEEDKRVKKIIQRRLVRCVLHHQKIVWFIKEVESIFGEAMVIQTLATVWVVCMVMYKIAGLRLLSVECLSMTVYLTCLLVQFFIYCYYGTQVKYESEFVNQSAYSGPWLSLSPAFRRQLLVMMEACSRPITPYIAYVIPISLETFIAVLRASYTLYTFLDKKKMQ